MEKYDNLDKFISIFSSISLEELNSKASMLERSENKYIFSLSDLYSLCDNLIKDFDILEINNNKEFTYETIYFDDKDNICYIDHHQWKRLRFKARTRKYNDSNIYFFELKLKDLRNKTNKKRFNCWEDNHWKLTQEAISFIEEHYFKLYNKKFNYNLYPSVKMSYKRITLVAKAGNERLTIDYDLTIYSDKWELLYIVPKDFIIIETKSSNWNWIADKIFKNSFHRPTSCSKFCLSKIISGQVNKINNFRVILKKYFPDILEKYNFK